MVDANGAYTIQQALALAADFAELGVVWLEEPVRADDLRGLRFIRGRTPAGMEVAAGEYGFGLPTYRQLLEARAVDVLQADATRCLGITGFLKVAALAEAFDVPRSTHCAPSIHAHAACAASGIRHVEYFFDHVRIEHLLFDGTLDPVAGVLRPDATRPGLGLDFKRRAAEQYAA